MRSYFKAYGDAGQTFLSASGGEVVYWVKKPRKITAINNFNFMSRGDGSASSDAILIWKFLDVQKGQNIHNFHLNHIITQDDIDNQATVQTELSGPQLANLIYECHNYASHPLN